MRRCARCGEAKPLDEFHRRAARRSGRGSRCKACKRADRKAYYERNAEKARADARADYEARRTDPTFRAQKAAKTKAWRDADPERARQSSNAGRVAWEKRHPEGLRLQRSRKNQTRHVARREAFVEHVEPLVVLERADGVCGICEEDVDPLRFDVDHIVPLALGGEHSYANTQPAHPRCNQSKGARR